MFQYTFHDFYETSVSRRFLKSCQYSCILQLLLPQLIPADKKGARCRVRCAECAVWNQAVIWFWSPVSRVLWQGYYDFHAPWSLSGTFLLLPVALMAPRGYADFTAQHYIAQAGVAELSEETFITHTRKAATEKAAIMAFSLCLNIYTSKESRIPTCDLKELSPPKVWTRLQMVILLPVNKRSNFSWRQLALRCRSNDH